MSADLLIMIKLAACFLLLFTIAELLYHFARLRAEITRKIVHTGTGVLTLLFPLYLQHLWQVIVLCTSFLLLLLASKRLGLLPSINAVARTTAGSLLYPVIVVITFAFYEQMQFNARLFHPLLYFYLPILVMAVCDPLAALGGKLYQRSHPQVKGKTLAGSICCCLSAFVLSALLLRAYDQHILSAGYLLLFAFAVSILTAVTERFSDKGWDNFTIPAVVMISLFLLEQYSK